MHMWLESNLTKVFGWATQLILVRVLALMALVEVCLPLNFVYLSSGFLFSLKKTVESSKVWHEKWKRRIDIQPHSNTHCTQTKTIQQIKCIFISVYSFLIFQFRCSFSFSHINQFAYSRWWCTTLFQESDVCASLTPIHPVCTPSSCTHPVGCV